MSGGNLWERVKKARLVQVLAGYLAASWIVLQLVDTLSGTFELPPWIGPVALILLVVGFVVVMATAWVQSHPIGQPRGEGAEAVPGSWELAAGEIKESLSRGEVPHLTWARALMGGVFAFSVLFGLAGVYVLLKDRGESLTPTEAVAGADAVPGIAVLPFAVSGSDLEEWREGMVNLLATNLDGAAGLRAINSRTVLARWDEKVGGEERADEATSLAVAREAGGRYALLGAAVAIGPSVRLTADVYDVGTAESLGYAQVEGEPDEVLELVDDLSIQVIRSIVKTGQGELPSMNLAGITTSSVPALKAFLEGEALYRRSEFGAATEAYERAVAADSAFALAYHRLASTYGWSNYQGHPLSVQAQERAAELIDRLPERAATFVRIDAASGEEAVELARQAVQRYPDDAEAWYLLGERYYHDTSISLASREEADAAFARAVELDPQFAPYRIHRMDLAFAVYDSALAAQRVEAYGSVAQNHSYRRGRLYLALAYGDSASRAEAARELGELSDLRMRTMTASVREDARLWRMAEIMLTELKERDKLLPLLAGRRASVGMQAGRLAQTLERLGRDTESVLGWEECSLWWMGREGLPVPEERLTEALSAAAIDTSHAIQPFCVGLHAAETGDWRLHERALGWIEANEASARDAGDLDEGDFQAALARGARGYGLWKRGDREEALSLLDSARLAGGFFWADVIGDLHVELGNLEEAVRYYRAVWTDPLVRLKLARAYEELDETARARDAYEYFVSAWADADPELQPMVEEAKEAMVRLMDDLETSGP